MTIALHQAYRTHSKVPSYQQSPHLLDLITMEIDRVHIHSLQVLPTLCFPVPSVRKKPQREAELIKLEADVWDAQ